MTFTDRADAGRQLARLLTHLQGDDVVVIGLPRGGVPVAAEVARELRAPLDVIVVRKLGVPVQPELAMGAIGEGGAEVVNHDVVRAAHVTAREFAAVEAEQRDELTRRSMRFRGERPRMPLAGKVVIVVDDGIATGSTARAACAVVRSEGASRVVLAVPVAPADWTTAARGRCRRARLRRDARALLRGRAVLRRLRSDDRRRSGRVPAEREGQRPKAHRIRPRTNRP